VHPAGEVLKDESEGGGPVRDRHKESLRGVVDSAVPRGGLQYRVQRERKLKHAARSRREEVKDLSS